MDKEYKTICDKCGKQTWYEEEQQCHCSYPKKKTCKTCGHSEEIKPYREVRCTGTLRKIDTSDLDPRFTPYYRMRVEVTWKKGYEDISGYGARTEGRKARFIVGKSTGWKPIYLMIPRSNCFGGAAIPSEGVESIRPL